VVVLAQSQKLIFAWRITYVMNRLSEAAHLAKKLRCQCPCGYDFETFSSKKDAVAMVQLHIERFHKDFLPFGITPAEALTFLKEAYEDGKTKIVKRSFSLRSNRPCSPRKRNHPTHRQTRRKELKSFS